jgi:Putative peptidoglycan binding domain
MKTYFVGWLRGTLLAALLLFGAQAARAGFHGGGGSHGGGGLMGSHGGSMGFHGGSMGSHFSGAHSFAFHNDHFGHFDHRDRFDHHDHDRFFRRDHDRFFFSFGFPYPYYWYDYYPYDYPYDYGYYDYGYYPYSGGDRYWNDLTAAVQTELARDGYYHGAINGVVTSDTVHAIRSYRKAKGLPVTSQIDRRLLRSMNI